MAGLSPRLRRVLPLLLVVAAGLAIAVPGLGLSSGASKDTIPDPNFGAHGCTACHGPHNEFRPLDTSVIRVNITAAEGGAALNGVYEAGADYVIQVSLDEQNAPGAGNHAGFNLRASGGKLAPVEGVSQVTTDGTQATHVNAQSTSWQVGWTAPDAGAVAFRLFVNDVDGSGAQDAADNVYQVFFGVTDHEGAELGSAEEEHVEFGISLQQYWIGLIGLFGMLAVMVAGFVYLKFANPHNTDPKDR